MNDAAQVRQTESYTNKEKTAVKQVADILLNSTEKLASSLLLP